MTADHAGQTGDPTTGERVIGIVGRELLILDDQCPLTGFRCDRHCGALCLRSEDYR